MPANSRISATGPPLRGPLPPRCRGNRFLRAPNVWAIAAGYFCFFYGAYFYLTWFPTYLVEYRHLPLKDIGLLASAPLITAMLGDLVGGLITDALLRSTGRLTWSRRIVAAPALLGAAGFLVPAATVEAAGTAILCLAASNFCLEMVLGPAWAVPMGVAGASSGTVTGVMNMAGAVGASISPLVFAMLVEHGSWVAPFGVTAAVLVSGAMIWIFLIDAEKPLVNGAARAA
jgi:MFS transporter, ACS family, glucarate transporter